MPADEMCGKCGSSYCPPERCTFHSPLAPDCEDDEPRSLEVVEADVRIEMAKHVAIKDRGFDTRAQRHEIHRKIDRLLDEYGLRADIAEVTA